MLTRNRQGQALPIIDVTLVALLGMAALAIDLAMFDPGVDSLYSRVLRLVE